MLSIKFVKFEIILAKPEYILYMGLTYTVTLTQKKPLVLTFTGGIMKLKLIRPLIIISILLLVFFISAICLRIDEQSKHLEKSVIGGLVSQAPKDVNIDLAESSLSRQTIQIINKQKLDLNEIYFRPSKQKAINSKFMDGDDFSKTFEDGKISSEFLKMPADTAINYFSVLQQAANIPEGKNVGCGSIGYGLEPFPIAYAFLTDNNKKSMTYDEFLKSFEGIGHINLLKLIPLADDSSGLVRYFIELEILESNDFGGTTFNYYTGVLDIAKVKNLYYVDALTLSPEDFFCAAYHGWAHNAESYVETVYGNWCGLIMKQYAADEDDYMKKIIIDGVDKKKYMFEFAKLTNGTDILINTLLKDKDKWVPFEIDVEKYKK